ncbi:hypothetical protein BN946_scf184449.g3 [Trametes cinnabarina]|uniref:Uncharacterized protein n=1 Tax=Pycnoporus cinnabarinus TaxID=5643 RepID=A0A060SPI4_PYCCI|nr:hypothetical protein BN946_scf184449.g3 [Trametes cinnabarina]
MDSETLPTVPTESPAVNQPVARPHRHPHPQPVEQPISSVLGKGQGFASFPARFESLQPVAQSMHSPFSSLVSGSGSGSSSNKLHTHSLGQGTMPSSQQSKTQSPDTLDLVTPPKLVESPLALPEAVQAEPFIVPPVSESSQDYQPRQDEPRERPQLSTNSGSGSSDSEDHIGPTRASIRAWAKATPAGPPRDTPSPHLSLLKASSSSSDNVSRVSLTRSAGRLTDTSQSSNGNASSASGDDSNERAVETEESSGNIADGESSGSDSRSPPTPPSDPSLPSSPPDDRAIHRHLTAHLAPLPPLPPPPPPLLRPRRPLQVMHGDSTDVLDEITKMLAMSRRPFFPDTGQDSGWVPLRGPPRGNDVLDDIYRMVMWSRRND